MALLATQSAVLARRRAYNAIQTFKLSSSISQALSTLFQELSQKKQNPDLQVIEIVQNGTSNVVLMDQACRLYGLFLEAVTTADSFQAADSATSASSPTIIEPLAIADTVAVLYPLGHSYANGITCNGLNSGANFTGFAIVGQP